MALRSRFPGVLGAPLALLAACGEAGGNAVKVPPATAADPATNSPPVALNADSPVEYPPALFEQGIEGKVVLRLFVDERGTVVPDSTRVAESSGYPALDSAALQAAPRLRFAPALRDGAPTAATFLQPVHFRHPKSGGAKP
ncbi:MAG TPA: energy transducer TonB [Gemmatimonadales bacterium]|nr:energy transducer TonB [Gemmatimonadales bacterium]